MKSTNPGHEARFSETYGDLVPWIRADQAHVLEAVAHLQQIEVERYYERRKLEWRPAFTLWLALAAIGALAIDNLGRKTQDGWVWALLVILAFFPILHGVFEARAIVPGAIHGRDMGYALSNLARARLGLRVAKPMYAYRPFFAHYWLVVVTALLVLAIGVILVAESLDPAG